MRSWDAYSYSASKLRELLSKVSGDPIHVIEESVHGVYLEEYFEKVRATSIVVEPSYVDHDFLEDYAVSLYAADERQLKKAGEPRRRRRVALRALQLRAPSLDPVRDPGDGGRYLADHVEHGRVARRSARNGGVVKPPRIGRPPLPKKLAKVELLPVRLAPEEKRMLERAAEESGVGLSGWARRVLLAAAAD